MKKKVLLPACACACVSLNEFATKPLDSEQTAKEF